MVNLCALGDKTLGLKKISLEGCLVLRKICYTQYKNTKDLSVAGVFFMFEINLFNTAQIFDQLFAFVCVYLLTSLSAKVRFYGFVIGTIGFVPGTYLLIVTNLWWLVACIPIWVFINYKGIMNNWREFKGIEQDEPHIS